MSLQGGLITHRIKEASMQGYVTPGDANNLPDEAIFKQRVLGRVVFAIPGVGTVIDEILSPTGIILLASLFLLVYLIQRVMRGREEEKQKIISFFLLLVFLVFSLKMAQETLGRYLKTLVVDDSAEAQNSTWLSRLRKNLPQPRVEILLNITSFPMKISEVILFRCITTEKSMCSAVILTFSISSARYASRHGYTLKLAMVEHFTFAAGESHIFEIPND